MYICVFVSEKAWLGAQFATILVFEATRNNGIASSNKGITTSSILAIRNKKLLVTPGIVTRSKIPKCSASQPQLPQRLPHPRLHSPVPG